MYLSWVYDKRSGKMKNLHIKCGNIKQRQNVIDVLESNGFELIGAKADWCLDLQTGDDAFAVTSHSPETQDELLWFADFMQKYAHGVLSGNGTNGTDIAENAEIRDSVRNTRVDCVLHGVGFGLCISFILIWMDFV